jgi:hypothetical protein
MLVVSMITRGSLRGLCDLYHSDLETFFFPWVQGIEPKALSMLDKCSTP